MKTLTGDALFSVGTGELQTDGIIADSFEALAATAIANMAGATGLCMVCGPITTGGTGNQAYNFQVFDATVKGLGRRGKQIFNQVPYEFGLRRLAQAWEAQGNSGYCMPILTTFYARVFESGSIGETWFIPGWESSYGARWEREKLAQSGCIIRDLTTQEICEFLIDEYPIQHADLIIGLLAKPN